jgi:alkylation response protein AidB-like acyl-CoA dehydrogenase
MNTEQIRQDVRDWLTSNWNPNLDLVRWRELLADSGWGAPDWPRDYFGRDLDPQLEHRRRRGISPHRGHRRSS